jgi:hypothetical protein
MWLASHYGRPAALRGAVIWLALTQLVSAASPALQPALGREAPKVADLIDAAKDMDAVSARLEQYGTITLSAPLLVRAANDGSPSVFEFKLTKDADAYFHDAQNNIQGKASAFNESIADLEVQARYGSDSTVASAYKDQLAERRAAVTAASAAQAKSADAAKAKYDAAIAAANAETDPTARATKTATAVDNYRADLKDIYPAPSAPPTQSALPNPTATISTPTISGTSSLSATQNPYALLSALGSSAPTITDRAAIIGAAGDNTVAGIFRVLGDPGKELSLSGQQAFFGVTMISVTPGRRTERSFFGNVSVVANIQLRKAEIGEVKNFLERWQRDYSLTADVETRIACDSDLSRTCTSGTPPAVEVLDLVTSKTRQDPTTTSRSIVSAADAYEKLPATLKGGVQSSDGHLTGSCMASSLQLGESCYLANTEDLPTVAAVSPMTDAQVLDYGSSSRDRKQVALDLAATMQSAGYSAAARVFAQYAKQMESDAISRAPQNFVAAYSSGHVFGYEIGPGFTALADPTSGKAESGQTLQRQSFPALIIVGIKPDLAQTKVYLVGTKDNQKLLVVTPAIYLVQACRWVPRTFWKSLFYRVKEDERVRWAQALDKAAAVNQGSSAGMVVYNRAIAMQALTGYSDATIPLPEPQIPVGAELVSLTSISPSTFVLDVDGKGAPIDTVASFLIQGKSLDLLSQHPSVLLNGKPIAGITFSAYGPAAGILKVSFRGTDSGTMFMSFPEEVQGKSRTTAALVGPVEIKVKAK